MSLLNTFKGWVGESFGAIAQWIWLDSSYICLNNITLQTKNGTTQIDHIILSPYGIFVVETKNINGWIFGGEKDKQWTIVKQRAKFKMQNPLHQNYRHTKALEEFLNISHSKIHSVVMFWGECEFKTEMPKNVLKNGYTDYIKSFNEQLFSTQEIQNISKTLKYTKSTNTISKSEHIQSIQDRLSSKTICSKCGSALVLRTIKKGEKAGKEFLGCSSYPKCRNIVDCE